MATRTARRAPSLLERASKAAARLDRRPGAHARHLARMRRWQGAKWAAGAAQVSGLGALAAFYGLLDSSVALVALGLLLLGAAWLMWTQGARTAFRRARLAVIGSEVEARVARTLDQSGLTVRHSVMLGAGGDADHVVCSAAGQLAVVETKTGKGTVRVDDDGRVLKASGPIHGDPLGQVLRQAAALSRQAGTPADAVLCVAAMTNRPFRSHGVWICSERDLPGLIERLPPRLQPGQGERIIASLAR